jgi:phage recombination protein Bet
MSVLAIRDDQSGFDAKQIAALRHMGVENAGPADQAIFFHQCVRTGLDPFARQIYMIGRNTKNPRTQQWETKYTIQTGIDGYRLIAARTGDHMGTDDATYSKDPLTGELVATVTVYKFVHGKRVPYTSSARWGAYVQMMKDKQTGKQVPNGMWAQRGPEQLAKCAEALALRKAFPQDLSGIYTAEEMSAELTTDDALSAESITVERSGPAKVQRKLTIQSAPVLEPPLEEPPLDVVATLTSEDARVARDFIDGTGEFAPETSHNPVTHTPISKPQLAKLHAIFGEMGITDRESRLSTVSNLVGRQVESSSDLTKAEAMTLIDQLEAEARPAGETLL